MPLFTYRSDAGQVAVRAARSDEAESGEAPTGTGGVQFALGRILAGFALLALVFAGGIYCAHDAAMKDWSAPLLHTFTLLLGGMVGIIIGEKTAAAP